MKVTKPDLKILNAVSKRFYIKNGSALDMRYGHHTVVFFEDGGWHGVDGRIGWRYPVSPSIRSW